VARVRAISIRNFRCVASLDWIPSAGLNCLIGRGDSGKSTILDAVDLCVGARRNAQFSDADFHALDTGRPISISVTLGDLPDAMRSMEGYGQFLRGFDPAARVVEDEPGLDRETVLTLVLTVSVDLEPTWSLCSDRAAAEGLVRNLAWADRIQLSPTRIGGSADANLSWRRGSVLSRLSAETPDTTAAWSRRPGKHERRSAPRRSSNLRTRWRSSTEWRPPLAFRWTVAPMRSWMRGPFRYPVERCRCMTVGASLSQGWGPARRDCWSPDCSAKRLLRLASF
jgi:hypothetical protein